MTTLSPKNWAGSRSRSPVKLGAQKQFDRAVALLHSFAYRRAEGAFNGGVPPYKILTAQLPIGVSQ